MGSRLNFLTCGSVDDGKSTLIGRMLYDAGQIYEDQIQALKADSFRYGTQGGDLDFALLLDGLRDERSQGITIDVAYRYFFTPNRSFVVADSPGHEQYTRNMAVAASTSDAGVVLIDVRKGIVTQTMRHLRILSTMGIDQVVLVANKMDLIEWDRNRFDEISQLFEDLAIGLGFQSPQVIPASAITGQNVFNRADLAWYRGPTLIEWLEVVPGRVPDITAPLCLPIQYVLRPNPDFRGYCGRIARGSLRSGEDIVVMPSGIRSTVRQILVAGAETGRASAGDSVCITLTDELDISRGDLVCSVGQLLSTNTQFQAKLIWLVEQPMSSGRRYWLKIHHATVPATISLIRHKVEIETGTQLSTRELHLHDIAVADISLDRPLPFAPYETNRELGGFILIDRISSATVAAGMISFELKQDHYISWQQSSINKADRAALKQQKPACIWLTGLSGAGKSTIADALEQYLFSRGMHTYILDGDNLRHGLNRDLGFTEPDRAKNTERIAEVAKVLVDAGLIAIVAIISPYRSDREHARSLFSVGEFVEVYVDTPLDVCETRDPKGLYNKARRGEIPNFTGISSPYEPPENPEVHISTVDIGIKESVHRIASVLQLVDENG